MKNIRTVVLWSLVLLLVVLAAGITFTIGRRPFVGPRVARADNAANAPTPDRLARGDYLVDHVTPCRPINQIMPWHGYGDQNQN